MAYKETSLLTHLLQQIVFLLLPILDYDIDPIFISKEIRIPVQGGLNPKILLADKENLKKEVLKYLDIFKDHPYIFNLGHGVMPETNVIQVDYLVKLVKDY